MSRRKQIKPLRARANSRIENSPQTGQVIWETVLSGSMPSSSNHRQTANDLLRQSAPNSPRLNARSRSAETKTRSLSQDEKHSKSSGIRASATVDAVAEGGDLSVMDLTAKTSNRKQSGTDNDAIAIRQKSPAPQRAPNNHNSRPSSTTSKDGFCEICNKIFCNKYYLRVKHKADAHNIFTDYASATKPAHTSSQSPKNNNDQQQQQQQTADLSNLEAVLTSQVFTSAFSTLPSALQNFQTYLNARTAEAGRGGAINVPNGIQSLLLPAYAAAGIPLNDLAVSALFNMGANEKPNNGNEPESASNRPNQFEQAVQSMDLLRQLGQPQLHDVNQFSLNAQNLQTRQVQPIFSASNDPAWPVQPSSSGEDEANKFGRRLVNYQSMGSGKLSERVKCEICLKEVCNKYFLKTHKAKIHGILIDNPPPTTTTSKTNNGGAIIGGGDREAPGAKIRSEISSVPPHDSEVRELPPMEENDREALRKTGIDPDAYCVLCMKSFCSKYFLRTHHLNIHNVKQAQAPRKPKQDPAAQAGTEMGDAEKTGLNGQPKPKSASLAQSRVKCPICNKELCNKYFLRSHITNVHKVDPITGAPLSHEANPTNTTTTNNNNNHSLFNHINTVEDGRVISGTVSEPVFLASVDNDANQQNNNHLEPGESDEAKNDSEQLNQINRLSLKRASSLPAEDGNPKTQKRNDDDDNNNDHFSEMQPFIIESEDPVFREKLLRSIVYLPMRTRVESPVHFNVKLRPLNEETMFQVDC